ncbi:ribonuclease HII [Dendrosporobacter sp. 1207_IL3150]|uniref:ribonuclease HII n=1 Tax=Dendrosporobacter sp. 1207_IL3150 TaxID=3084054 RepID=UPI002FDA5025
MHKSHLTVAQVSSLLAQDNVPESAITSLKDDSRVSVIRLLQKWQQRQLELEIEKERLRKMFFHEQQLYDKGIKLIAGVDEAGRGPLAGPVVIGAAILPIGYHLPYLNDSKKLSAIQRLKLYQDIKKNAITTTHIVVDATQIDELNIYQATVKGMYEAIASLTPQPEAVLIDAVPLTEIKIPSLSLINGDALSASIAAASIIAKVERDAIMENYDNEFPGYGFAKHKGYGTAEHIKAINSLGPCTIHRKSFEPIKSWGDSNEG